MSKTVNILLACLIVVLVVGLYRAKTEADGMRAQVSRLESEVASARAEVKTMAAEAAYLENPERIESLARKELGLKPASLSQRKTLDQMDEALPAPEKRKAPTPKDKAAP